MQINITLQNAVNSAVPKLTFFFQRIEILRTCLLCDSGVVYVEFKQGFTQAAFQSTFRQPLAYFPPLVPLRESTPPF